METEKGQPNGHPPPRVRDFRARLETFRSSDDKRDAMVEELINQLETLTTKHEEVQYNYDNEAESRRRLQHTIKHKDEELKLKDQELNELRRTTESRKEAYVLLDGDGAIFLDELITRGRDGGAEAAHKLQAVIQKYLQGIYPDEHVDNWNIIVQVYVNLEGLCRKMQACGIVANYKEFADFARAFTMTQPFFDIVDVGAGKENADFKLRNKLPFVLKSVHCAHVIVGPCHDYGYLNEFRQYGSEKVKRKITLLEATPSQPGFESLGFGRLSFPEVFRSQSLPDTPAHSVQSLRQRAPSADGGASLTTPTRADAAVASPPAPAPPASTASDTWASVSRANGHGPGLEGFTLVNNRKKHSHAKFYEVSRSGCRIDPALPRPAQAAVDRLNARRQATGLNPCNNYHITGNCRNLNCRYEHGERMLPDEAAFLRVKARGSRCSSGKHCEDFDCYLGHHCVRPGACNFGSTCHFYETHGLDLTPARRFYDDGTEADLTMGN